MMDILKKAKKGMSENERDAKLDVLKFISDAAEDAIAGKVKGLKKVTVASNSEEGLEKGLEVAKEKIGEKGLNDFKGIGSSKEDESEDEEYEDESEEDEDDSLDKEAIEAKLAKLIKMKEKLESK